MYFLISFRGVSYANNDKNKSRKIVKLTFLYCPRVPWVCNMQSYSLIGFLNLFSVFQCSTVFSFDIVIVFLLVTNLDILNVQKH